MKTEWIAQRIHWETTPQDGPRRTEALCAILTGHPNAPTTSDFEQVTCDACKALDIAMTFRGGVTISST
jgi:hypothetical protein